MVWVNIIGYDISAYYCIVEFKEKLTKQTLFLSRTSLFISLSTWAPSYQHQATTTFQLRKDMKSLHRHGACWLRVIAHKKKKNRREAILDLLRPTPVTQCQEANVTNLTSPLSQQTCRYQLSLNSTALTSQCRGATLSILPAAGKAGLLYCYDFNSHIQPISKRHVQSPPLWTLYSPSTSYALATAASTSQSLVIRTH